MERLVLVAIVAGTFIVGSASAAKPDAFLNAHLESGGWLSSKVGRAYAHSTFIRAQDEGIPNQLIFPGYRTDAGSLPPSPGWGHTINKPLHTNDALAISRVFARVRLGCR